MHPLLRKLTGGDRRSIGRAGEVVSEVLKTPRLFGVLFDGMLSDDPLIRMRAADAAEKITLQRPDLLQPHCRVLIRKVAAIPQQEVRWHVALMLPRLKLSARERAAAVDILVGYLGDDSRIVRVCGMQGLAELAEREAPLLPPVKAQLENLAKTGSPAVRSRAAKLLNRLRRKWKTNRA